MASLYLCPTVLAAIPLSLSLSSPLAKTVSYWIRVHPNGLILTMSTYFQIRPHSQIPGVGVNVSLGKRGEDTQFNSTQSSCLTRGAPGAEDPPVQGGVQDGPQPRRGRNEGVGIMLLYFRDVVCPAQVLTKMNHLLPSTGALGKEAWHKEAV